MPMSLALQEWIDPDKLRPQNGKARQGQHSSQGQGAEGAVATRELVVVVAVCPDLCPQNGRARQSQHSSLGQGALLSA